MAQTEHLPIYKSSYDLCLYLEQTVRSFSRYQKYGLGAELREGARHLDSFPPGGGRLGWGGTMDSTARSLRKHPTEAERLLWRHLRLRQLGGWKFRRRQPVGPYIVDFVCLEKRLSSRWMADTMRSRWRRMRGALRGWKPKAFSSYGSGIQTFCET